VKYHPGELEVQTRAGVRVEASRIIRSIHATVPPVAQDFLRNQRMIVLSSVDREDHVWASVLTGEPGFIQTPDEQTIEINAMPQPFDPLVATIRGGGAIGMIAIEFATRRRIRVNGWAKSEQERIIVLTEQVYANCPKYIQVRSLQDSDADTSASNTAERQCAHTRQKELTNEQCRWIEQADTFFIASSHKEGGSDVSHRGGRPGFIQVQSATHLVFPDYSGNMMFQTLGNINVDPHAGLLFLDFERGNTLHLTGRAQVIWDKERLTAFAGAERLVEFTVDEVIEVTEAIPLRWRLREYSPFLPDPEA
jgi:uncharacterized protein